MPLRLQIFLVMCIMQVRIIIIIITITIITHCEFSVMPSRLEKIPPALARQRRLRKVEATIHHSDDVEGCRPFYPRFPPFALLTASGNPKRIAVLHNAVVLLGKEAKLKSSQSAHVLGRIYNTVISC